MLPLFLLSFSSSGHNCIINRFRNVTFLNRSSFGVWRLVEWEDPGNGRSDPEKARFVRTEALPICPDCTWPPRDFSKIIVRTSIIHIWHIFCQNYSEIWGKIAANKGKYLEKMISVRIGDLAISKKTRCNLKGEKAVDSTLRPRNAGFSESRRPQYKCVSFAREGSRNTEFAV